MLIIAIGLGLMWHGIQVVWVAPRPSQFQKDKPVLEAGSSAAFNRFWLDQYAWIGISLSALGLGLVVWGAVV